MLSALNQHTTMTHIYWLGGSPCAGKSTVAEMLARAYDWLYINCDSRFGDHQQQSDPHRQPTLHRLATLTSDEIWLTPVLDQVARVIAIYREEFPLLLADLAVAPTERPILLEGAALLPELVAPLATAEHAAWLVPTPTFQQHHYAQRPWIRDVLKGCSDPAQAFANWMQRDISFAQYVITTAQQHGLPLLQVDGSQSLAQTAAWVATQWGLPSTA